MFFISDVTELGYKEFNHALDVLLSENRNNMSLRHCYTWDIGILCYFYELLQV